MHLWTIWLLASAFYAAVAQSQQRRPNILVVLTDDQDLQLDGMFPMQQTQRFIGAAGATFTNAFTSSPLCCPSRASILTGRYAHNTRTTNNSVSGGCYSAHWRREWEPKTVPVLLQQTAGYDTFYAGKYLNQYYGQELPPGWTEFHGLHGNSRYYNYTLRENTRNVSYTDAYLTDVLRHLALDFLDKTKRSNRPFFAMIAPPAPHAPYTPADRHRNAFAGIQALRTPNFNRVPRHEEKHWLLSAFGSISNDTLARLDTYFQGRWEALLSVDELVATLLARLQELGQLDNTYVVYTSDNGYHVGQFAQPFDKRQPYETDIHVPLLVRGPGVAAGLRVDSPALLLDLFPTILDWAQISPASNATYDGLSLRQHLTGFSTGSDDSHYDRRLLLIQHWGEGNTHTHNAECPWAGENRLSECTVEADCHCQDVWNNTYACIRHLRRGGINRLYCEFRDNENFVEAYDLDEDPFEMNNRANAWLPIERAFYNLALDNLTKCAGVSCTNVTV